MLTGLRNKTETAWLADAPVPPLTIFSWLVGLKVFPDAINAVCPEPRISLCIVARNCLHLVAWKDYIAAFTSVHPSAIVIQLIYLAIGEWAFISVHNDK